MCCFSYINEFETYPRVTVAKIKSKFEKLAEKVENQKHFGCFFCTKMKKSHLSSLANSLCLSIK